MSTYVDFKELKSQVTIDQVVAMLGLDLKRHRDQLRGRCPIHKGGNDREFVVTPAKGLFYCFGGCGGGDLIALVAAVKGCDQKQAAHAVAEHFGLGTVRTVPATAGTVNSTRNSSPQPLSRQEGTERILQPLAYLEAEHELVQALGLSAQTAASFGAGYAPKGILRGRLAIPIRDRGRRLIAYCGRTVRDESPLLTFPNGFDPAAYIFNADRVGPGSLALLRDPLQVLIAHEHGIDSAVAFLTEAVTAEQLERLAALMDEIKAETVELF